MASYSALFELNDFLSRNKGSSLEEAIDVIKKTSSDASSLDFVGARELLEVIGVVPNISGSQGIRLLLLKYLKVTRPRWLASVPTGREQVKLMLDSNEVQCLRVAGLFDAEPCRQSVEWWDEVGALARSENDIEKMKRAREAERLSMEHEQKRLKKLGISMKPVWVSLDDNTVGYDIKSYDIEDGAIVSRLVEVKSTLSNEIYISRNEWQNAKAARHSYYFHVWKIPTLILKELTVSEVETHIPKNQGKGEWIDTSIKVNF